MKKILKYSLLAVLSLGLASLTGCKHEELDTDQFNGYSLAAVAPNPVVRGAVLRIVGGGLENTAEVRFTGGISVTDIEVVEKGAKSEIRVTVPLEGPEVGPVTVVSKSGETATTLADLEFAETIEVDSFSPAEALSGDIITIKGEYLNDVLCVIFADEVKTNTFVSQSRYEIKVAVPANAVTGPVIVSNVDEVNDENTIPSRIYTASDLVIGNPTVDVAKKTTYKSGDVITVTGAHLDMIETLNLNGASDVEFTVAEDGNSLSFTLPASASDGEITLISYAGTSFSAGEIETVTVADLDIVSLAEDGRYKAGTTVEISGSDLDLVTKVEFVNAEAWFWMENGKIYATVPAAAKDGSVTVTLGSGKQAWTPEIEVVKPVVTGVSATTAVAGKESLTVTGTDLDLVTSVTIGDKAQSFIPCEFYVVSSGELSVAIPSAAYTGVLTVTADSGYSSTTETIEITYDEVISVVFDAPSFALGRNISLTGSNLLQVESISIKGNKVMQYSVREDGAMSFAIPEGVGPGVYRLVITLVDGTVLTWPVPFEITASYTETYIWQGEFTLSGWNSDYFGAEGAFTEAGIQVGDVVRIYYDAPLDGGGWWGFQLYGGHWDGLSLGELDGGQMVSSDNAASGTNVFFSFEVTEAVLAQLTSVQGWGGSMTINGDNAAIKGISLIHYGATETVVWEGVSDHTGDYANNISLGGEDDWVDAGLTEGSEIRIYFTPDDPSDWSIQVFDGHWGNLKYVTPNGEQWNQDNSPEAVSKGYVSFIAEGDAFTALTTHAWWGNALILQGKNVVFTKLAFQ